MAFADFVEKWGRMYGDRPMLVKDLVGIAEGFEDLDLGRTDNPQAKARALGKLLKTRRDATIRGWKIAGYKRVQEGSQWWLAEVGSHSVPVEVADDPPF